MENFCLSDKLVHQKFSVVTKSVNATNCPWEHNGVVCKYENSFICNGNRKMNRQNTLMPHGAVWNNQRHNFENFKKSLNVLFQKLNRLKLVWRTEKSTTFNKQMTSGVFTATLPQTERRSTLFYQNIFIILSRCSDTNIHHTFIICW